MITRSTAKEQAEYSTTYDRVIELIDQIYDSFNELDCEETEYTIGMLQISREKGINQVMQKNKEFIKKINQ